MKAIISGLLGALLVAAPIEMAAAQAGNETFQISGEFNGRSYSSVTVNDGNNTSTLNFDDGGQFTQRLSEESIQRLIRSLRSREEGPGLQ